MEIIRVPVSVNFYNAKILEFIEFLDESIIFEYCHSVMSSTEGILNSLGTTSSPHIVTCNRPKFNELRYFTKITALTSYNNFYFSQAKFPPSLRTIDYYIDTWGHLPIIDFPSTLTTISYYFWLRLSTDASRVIILRSETPPSVGTSYYDAKKIGVILVPSHLVETYKAASGWSKAAAKIQPLEGSKYEVFNEWEYDD